MLSGCIVCRMYLSLAVTEKTAWIDDGRDLFILGDTFNSAPLSKSPISITP